MNFLNGKKSYIVSGVLVLLGGLQAAGIQIPGVQLGDNWVITVLGGLGLGSLRHSIR